MTEEFMCRICLFYAEDVKKMHGERLCQWCVCYFTAGKPPSFVCWYLESCDKREGQRITFPEQFLFRRKEK